MSKPPSVSRGQVRPHQGRVSFAPFFPAQPAVSWVRIALVHGGAIVDEKLIAPDQTLTWGASDEAMLSVPGAHVGCEVLVRPGETGPLLVVPSGSEGRLIANGREVDVRAARGEAIELGTDGKGRLTCGEFALLIARCAPPARRSAPQLPASVQGGLLRHADWSFTAFVAASLIAHGSLVTVLSEMDFPYAGGPRDHTAQPIYVEADLPMVEAPPDPVDERITDEDPSLERVAEGDTSPAPSERMSPREVRRPRISGDTVARVDGAESIDPSALAEEVGTHLTLGVLASEGLADLLRQGAPTPDEAELLASVRGTELATREPGAMRDRSSVRPGDVIGDVGSLARTATGPRGEGAGPIGERRISVPAPAAQTFEVPRGGTPQETDLVHAIRGRMGAVRACYERELRDRPDLAGRLVVQVTAELSGTLSGVRTLQDTMDATRLQGCVEDALRSVRLRQPPTDEPLTASFPLVFAPQQ